MSQPVPPASPLYQPSGTRKVGSGYPTDSTCLYLGLRGQYFEFVHGSTARDPSLLSWPWGSAPSGSGGPSSAVGLTSLPIVKSHADSAAMLVFSFIVMMMSLHLGSGPLSLTCCVCLMAMV